MQHRIFRYSGQSDAKQVLAGLFRKSIGPEPTGLFLRRFTRNPGLSSTTKKSIPAPSRPPVRVTCLTTSHAW
eukprot:1649279-Pyramimonas_sp.AAC.1